MYTHAASPLRKAASSNYLRQRGAGAAGKEYEASAINRVKKEGSPLKRMSTPGDFQRDVTAAGVGLNHRLKSFRSESDARRESGRV